MVETPEKTGNGAPGAEILHLAAYILRIAGLDAGEIARVLRDLYGVEVDVVQVESWLNTTPRWQGFPIHRLDKNKLQALRYAVGAALGDGDGCGRLEVRDWDFARAYASAIATLTGDPDVKVRRRKERYRVGCRLVGFIAKSPLWKVVAYLDKLDERKHFLSGLLDAEGSIIPIVDKKRKNLRVRVQFANTDRELANLVMDALKELGFEPRIRVEEPGDVHVKKDGEAVRRKKTLYKVYADINLSKIAPLAKVSLNCARKKLLLEFFLSVRKLPPRQRYEKFTRCWTKIGDKWMPVSLSNGRGKRRQRKLYIVECPMCREAGIFELRREVDGGKVRVRILIHHGRKVCELSIAEKEVREGESTARINCPRCGRPGHVYTTVAYVKLRRPYKYLIVGASHRFSGRKTSCTLTSMRLLSIQAQQPQPPSAHH